MRKFEELNYYQLLDVPYDATFTEIRLAYKDALLVYEEDSLSTYALFDDEERRRLLKTIEEAFQTLSDQQRRSQYDDKLIDEGLVDPAVLNKVHEKKSIPIFKIGQSNSARSAFYSQIKEKTAEPQVTAAIQDIHSKELLSGQDLKQLRLLLDIGLEDIFDVARISGSILQAIEEDRIEDLPPLIYLKNFLASYAEILQLNPKKVVDTYIINVSLKQTAK